ncbi:MAG TPA: hypothetical protein H9807_01175 [Candidatus Bacteroides merdavium]|uniref:Uncharacterized protein n=1 Tax=Candidatus Bacteroides merdavium TaxID=2838472 RepID=A0A9D2KCC4_9BACE|nr:hypothetical protein [Candidatus Bacteroides merdavium]
MSSIFHTDRKWVAGLCYVGFLVLTLMVAAFVFFLVMNLWIDKDAKSVRILGWMVWIYGWSYLYHRWVRRRTTWLA